MRTPKGANSRTTIETLLLALAAAGQQKREQKKNSWTPPPIQRPVQSPYLYHKNFKKEKRAATTDAEPYLTFEQLLEHASIHWY
jgi:hypothetical protein